MPKSKNRKDHKQKLENFKNKQKNMSNQQIPQMPPVRNFPVWDPNAKIEVMGYEWEAIQNGLVNVQMAMQAAQSIMSRNILNGTISMDFEKLNPQTMQYEPMSEDERKPHAEEFEKQVEAFKTAAAQAPVQGQDTEARVEVPQDAAVVTPIPAKLVDMNGDVIRD